MIKNIWKLTHLTTEETVRIRISIAETFYDNLMQATSDIGARVRQVDPVAVVMASNVAGSSWAIIEIRKYKEEPQVYLDTIMGLGINAEIAV